jgi:CheY-like chemotaxis protein
MIPDPSLPPIMIVDDDEDDMLLLARRLQAAGVRNRLLNFRNGGEAFLFLKPFCPPAESRGKLPAIMFLDVNMPGLSGFDVLAWVRQQPALANMKVFMLSGANEAWDAQIATKLGADEYLLKFPPAESLTALLTQVGTLSPA